MLIAMTSVDNNWKLSFSLNIDDVILLTRMNGNLSLAQSLIMNRNPCITISLGEQINIVTNVC